MATVKLRIGPADHGRRMTMEDFLDAEEEPGYLYELGRGVLEVTQIPADPHWQLVDAIHEGFSLYRREHPGWIRRIGHGSEVRLLIPEMDSGRHPDLAVVFQGATRDASGHLRPTLAVEVVSPGHAAHDRDYVAKREEYLAFGLLEYWIVDRSEGRVTVLSRREGEPTWSERVFRGPETILSPLLPGFAGTVESLWADEGGDEAE